MATRTVPITNNVVGDFLYDTDGSYEQDLADHAVQADDVLLGVGMEREETSPYRQFFRFPNDYQRTLIFQLTVPTDYTDTPVLQMIYDTAGGAAGDVRMVAQVLANSDGEDMVDAAYDSANAATDTAEGTVDKTNLWEITLTNADSMAAKDIALIKLTRTPGNVGDTVDADVPVYVVNFVFNDA